METTKVLIEELQNEDFAGELQHLRSWSEIDRLFETAANRLSDQQQLINDLLAALYPFAKLGQEAAWLTKSDDAQAWGFDGTNLYWGNFRLALEAYSRAKGINKDRK